MNNTLDVCYGNVPNAFKSVALPPIGSSDHDTVHLLPAYRPRIQTEPIVKKSVKVWTPESVDQLRGCFDCTDWNVLIDSCESVHEAADVVTDYISFCEDLVIPTKTVKLFPNNKPWISKSTKHLLNEKKVAFQTGNRVERKLIQGKLKRGLRQEKREYKEKIERQFESGNMKNV